MIKQKRQNNLVIQYKNIKLKAIMTTKKQIDGTRNQIISIKSELRMRGEQSKLPIQNILNDNKEAGKQLNYRSDERNPRVIVDIQYRGQNNQNRTKQLHFRKGTVATLFSTIEKIQDEINSYM